MSERDTDFDDLVDGGEQFADADEGTDAGKKPVEGDEGADGADADKAGADDKGKTPEDDGGDDDDKDDKASKDGAADDKDGKDADADKDAAKDKMVPKAALDSEKRRRRELAARLKRIEDRLGAEDAEVARRAIPKEGTPEHATYVARQSQVVALNDRLNFSEYNARKEYGNDVVTEAFEWANAQMEDPAKGEQFAKTLFAHAHPYDYAVVLFKEAQEAGNGGGAPSGDPDFEAFKAWKATQGKTGDGGAAPKPKGDEPPARRPQSLAERPSAAGPKGDELVVDPFGAEFDR